jgi:serine phosphatase RsbU (regulator of sigma subunit)
MTLIASSSLSKALEQFGPQNPAALLAAVNRSVKGLLGQVKDVDDSPESDDGMDAAFFWFDTQRSELTFAGARIALHILRPDADQFDTLAGQRMGVGYVDSRADYEWTQTTVAVPPESLLFIATDGLIDQIGGPRKIAFGKRQACHVILEHRSETAGVICEKLRLTLSDWQATQTRRDDLTLFCARIQDNL